MVLALLLSLVAPATVDAGPAAVRLDDPPVRISLNQDSYFQRGDRARVHVKTAEDGYLVVLRADADGRVRVLFPLDPGDDDFVRGGKTIEVRGRGDREAFSIDEREGTGVVLAARSVAPFRFDEFVRADHWDYRVLDTRQTGGDKEATLLDIVQRMVPDAHFDYDVVTYSVAARIAYYPGPCFGCGSPYYGWPHRFSFGLAFGRPFSRFGFAFRSGCFDPFFFDPFFCGPAFFDPFFFDPFFFDPFFFGPFVSQPFIITRPFIFTRARVITFVSAPRFGHLFINRARPGFRGPLVFKDPGSATVMGPRLRVPQGTLLSRSRPGPAPVRVVREGTSAREPAFPIRDRRNAPVERRVPAVRMPERREAGTSWSRPERRSERVSSGGGRTPAVHGRGWSSPGFSGRASPPANHGGGRRH